MPRICGLTIGLIFALPVIAQADAFDHYTNDILVKIGKAEIHVLTKHLPEADPKKIDKVIVGPKFEMKYFNGVYRLYDDGRRSGKLVLKVDEDGDVNGHYYSDKNEAKYVVTGRVGDPA